MQLFGSTRTVVKSHYALITPDSHIPSVLPGWTGGIVPYYLITPGMGADLVQMRITWTAAGKGHIPADSCSRFIYSQGTGTANIAVKYQGKTKRYSLSKNEQYIFVPPFCDIDLSAKKSGAELTLFKKEYSPLDADIDLPPLVYGNASDIKPEPFMGFKGAMLTTILPVDDLRFDMAVNLFRYDPGATLPLVETHIMEHGLIMVEGQGVYRLQNDYYPVQKNDVIWMAPHCPQWYVSMGYEKSAYLYYKDVNRDSDLL